MHSRKARYTDPDYIANVYNFIKDGYSTRQIAILMRCGWHTVQRARHIIEGRIDKVKARYDNCDLCGKEVLLEGKAINCDDCQRLLISR